MRCYTCSSRQIKDIFHGGKIVSHCHGSKLTNSANSGHTKFTNKLLARGTTTPIELLTDASDQGMYLETMHCIFYASLGGLVVVVVVQVEALVVVVQVEALVVVVMVVVLLVLVLRCWYCSWQWWAGGSGGVGGSTSGGAGDGAASTGAKVLMLLLLLVYWWLCLVEVLVVELVIVFLVVLLLVLVLLLAVVGWW